ncbi:MAG: hypothetical protein C4557_06655 [Anaerolineaceae bacterium]|jgi:hypothetical protein|nr:MAG: hypothetical protein C4557_06655 [Anaerolineaceae bacterium]
MKRRFPFWTLSLIAVFLAVSCAPAVPTETAVPVDQIPPVESAVPETEAVTESPAEAEVQPVATSRGSALEATDPSTVSLASGQLQLIEFFRFT